MKKSVYVILSVITIGVCFLLISMGGSERLEKKDIKVGGIVINVEIADDSESRRTGLMNRKSLPEDNGMLFIFENDQKLSFWMKNTFIPLSIAYISAEGEIMEVYDMKPESLRPVESISSVRYALEMNQGWFERNAVGPGDMVIFD